MNEEFISNFDTIKAFLIKSIPYMRNIKAKEWDCIKKSYNKRLFLINKEDNITSFKPLVPKSLIDYAIGANHPSSNEVALHCKQWISALNRMIEKAIKYSSTSQEQAKQIHEKIMHLLTTIEANDDPNSDFKNTLNELLVYNYLYECENVEVKQIEMKIESGKSIDYVIQRKSDKKKIGLEVMTMQGINPEKQENDKEMTSFLIQRIKNKHKDKVKDAKEIKELDDLLIFPIIEDTKGLEKFSFDIQCDISVPIRATSFRKDENGEWNFYLYIASNYFRQVREGKVLQFAIDNKDEAG